MVNKSRHIKKNFSSQSQKVVQWGGRRWIKICKEKEELVRRGNDGRVRRSFSVSVKMYKSPTTQSQSETAYIKKNIHFII